MRIEGENQPVVAERSVACYQTAGGRNVRRSAAPDIRRVARTASHGSERLTYGLRQLVESRPVNADVSRAGPRAAPTPAIHPVDHAH